MSEKTNRYLVARGVPQEIIDQTNSIGPTKLNFVRAIKLAEVGALTALFDGGKIISANVAKWLGVERAVTQGSKGDALAAVLSSIRLSSPDVVDREANRLYTALDAKDAIAFRDAISNLTDTIREAAIDAADPAITFAYLEATLHQLRYLSMIESWNTCAEYADGRGIALLNDASISATNEELLALAELIRSAGKSGWARGPIPSWAEKQGFQILAKSLRVFLDGKMDFTKLEANPRIKCLWMTEFMNQVDQLGELRGVAAFRWITTHGKKP